MKDANAAKSHVLKTGVDAMISYGGRYVPCEVVAIRKSYPHERFQNHKTVRVKAEFRDLEVGQLLTSEVGNVFPASAALSNGGIADYVEIRDLVSANEFAIRKGMDVVAVDTAAGRYVGKVLHQTGTQLVQHLGRDRAVIHDRGSFADGFQIEQGNKNSVAIQYSDGKAAKAANQMRALVR